jgi:DNA-binding CsgD family transcriptional regulator
MSTRGLPEDHTIGDYLLDLEAVVDRLGLDSFVLMAGPLMNHVAVRYAVKHPERVEALLLGHLAIDTAWGAEVYEELARRNWDLFLHTIASAFSLDRAPLEVPYWRAALDRDDFFPMVRAARSSKITALLPHVRAPTLISVARRLREGEPDADLTRAQAIAALIPDCRLHIEDAFGASVFSDGSAPPAVVLQFEKFLEDIPHGGRRDRAAHDSLSALSQRQRQILRLIAGGKTNSEIAEELVLSVRTVERHITNIYAKIGARGKADAAVYALRHALI